MRHILHYTSSQCTLTWVNCVGHFTNIFLSLFSVPQTYHIFTCTLLIVLHNIFYWQIVIWHMPLPLLKSKLYYLIQRVRLCRLPDELNKKINLSIWNIDHWLKVLKYCRSWSHRQIYHSAKLPCSTNLQILKSENRICQSDKFRVQWVWCINMLYDSHCCMPWQILLAVQVNHYTSQKHNF